MSYQINTYDLSLVALSSGNSSSSAVNDASFNNVEISNNLLINGHIDANDASFNNVDVSGDLTVNGNVTANNIGPPEFRE